MYSRVRTACGVVPPVFSCAYRVLVCVQREAFYRPRIRVRSVWGVLSPVFSRAYRERRFIARVFAYAPRWAALPPSIYLDLSILETPLRLESACALFVGDLLSTAGAEAGVVLFVSILFYLVFTISWAF